MASLTGGALGLPTRGPRKPSIGTSVQAPAVRFGTTLDELPFDQIPEFVERVAELQRRRDGGG